MSKQQLILKKLILIGGIYGKCAEMYYNDRIAAKLFIYEISEHCDLEYTKTIWDKDFINEIKTYTKK